MNSILVFSASCRQILEFFNKQTIFYIFFVDILILDDVRPLSYFMFVLATYVA